SIFSCRSISAYLLFTVPHCSDLFDGPHLLHAIIEIVNIPKVIALPSYWLTVYCGFGLTDIFLHAIACFAHFVYLGIH
ncbi:MAG: hypothetical protein WCA04_10695, partial [Geobacteraceae bacterium]